MVQEISNTHFSKAVDSDITAYLIDMTHILLNFNTQLKSEFQQADSCFGNLTRQSQ